MVPKYFASRSASSAMTAERPCTMSLTRAGLTSMSRASRFWLMPFGPHEFLEQDFAGRDGIEPFCLGHRVILELS